MATPLVLRLLDALATSAVDSEADIVSLNKAEVAELLRAHDTSVRALQAIWNNPEHGRTLASEALKKINPLKVDD